MLSSSRSVRLRPSWLPSVLATRLATGMKVEFAGILSSARSRLAIPGLLFLLGAAVRGLLDLRARRGLELLAPPLRRRHAVLDRLADRVVGVGHDRPRLLRGFLRLLHGLARGQLDRLAAQVVDLAATRTRRDVCAGDQTEHSAEEKPTEPTAAAISVFCHRSYLTPPRNERTRLWLATLAP